MAGTLRGLVYDKHKSIRAFAVAIGWNRTKANDIVNLKQEPRVTDLQAMAVALDKSVEEVASFFLPSKSQNCDDDIIKERKSK